MVARLFAVALLLSAVALAACGDKDDSGGSSGAAASSDAQYLAVFCTGLTKYQETLVSATKVDDIRKVIEDYIGELEKITPPDGLEKYHKDYIRYLREALDDPTSLVTTKPPMPPESDRERLSEKTKGVAECKYPTFLDRQPQPKG